jgi:hypothetical protein
MCSMSAFQWLIIASSVTFNYRSANTFVVTDGDVLKKLIILSSSILLILISNTAISQDAISTNTFVSNSPGQVIENQVVAHFIGSNTVASIKDLGLPLAADIAALHYVNDTTVLFTLKSTAQLGLITAKAGDVMQWSSGAVEILH